MMLRAALRLLEKPVASSIRGCIAIFVFLSLPAHAGPSTTLKDYPGVTASIDTQEGVCPAAVPVTVRSQKPSELHHGSRVLLKIMAWAQLNIASTCPTSEFIEISGLLDGKQIYKGKAKRSDGWALIDTTPPAANATDYGSAVPNASLGTANQSPVPSSPSATHPQRTETRQIAAAPSVALFDAQTAQCDRLAAHPDDPEAVTAGLADEKIDAKAAIAACEAAVKSTPALPRLSFQLARAYLRANRLDDAIDRLLLAAEEGHGGALAYLADIYVGGAPGIEADPANARVLYEKSVASGFEPARRVLAEFVDMTEQVAKQELAEAETENIASSSTPKSEKEYSDILQMLYEKRPDDIPYGETWTKEYLHVIADNINAVCEAHITKKELQWMEKEKEKNHIPLGEYEIAARARARLVLMAEMWKFSPEFVKETLNSENVDSFTEAMKDTPPLLNALPCKSQALEKFSINLKAYMTNADAPISRPGDVVRACQADPPPSHYSSAEFCLCFAGGLEETPVSQKRRKLLFTDFKKTAIAIMDTKDNRRQFNGCRYGVK